MKKLILCIIPFLLIACNTQKLAIKRIDKISHKYPEVIAEKCKTSFNPSDSIHESISFLPGETTYVDNFIEVDCDSFIKYITHTKILKAKCPPSITIRDTILKDKFAKEIDKASIFLLEKSKDSLSQIIIEQKTKIKTKNKTLLIIGTILGLIIIGFIIKNYIKTII